MKIVLPGQNEPITLGGEPLSPIWYEKLKFLERLQPLSDVVFPTPPAAVTSIDGVAGAFTLGNGLARTSQALRTQLTTLSATLAATVLLNNAANFFDGPFIAQGTSGLWFVSGNVTTFDSSAAVTGLIAKLWDGTTIISQGSASAPNGGNGHISLSGIINNPTGNLRISVRDPSSVNGTIQASGNSNICAVRIG